MTLLRSATLLPRRKDKKLWSTSDTIITTTKARIPRKRKKFKSANPVERIRHSDHYIQKAIRDYEEKRMQAIAKEENSRTEMMVQRMRDRDALKMWRQQSLKQIETRKGQRDNDTTVLIQRNHTLDSIGPLKQRAVTMTDKEAALRNKIKEHANRLRAYHAQAENQKKRGEASYNLSEAQSMHDEISKLTQEYRFKAFTGELMDY